MKKLIVPVLAATSALGFAVDSDAVSAADFKVKIHHQTPAVAPVNKFVLTPLKKALKGILAVKWRCRFIIPCPWVVGRLRSLTKLKMGLLRLAGRCQVTVVAGSR